MREETKEKWTMRYEAAKEWCKNNKEVIIAVAPPVLGWTAELFKMVVKKGYISEEKRLKNNYIYDRDKGHYYELKRTPKSSEWLQIDHMREVGDVPLGVILNDMKLLK